MFNHHTMVPASSNYTDVTCLSAQSSAREWCCLVCKENANHLRRKCCKSESERLADDNKDR